MTTRSSAKGDKISKKPISIGAALRQRMTGQTSELPNEPEVPNDADGNSIETSITLGETNSLLNSDLARETQEMQSSQMAPPAIASQAAQVVEQLDDPLESFNTRLRRSLLKRMKVYSAVHGLKIQDLVDVALEQYFTDKKDNKLD